jgi:hypothetical protein
MLRTRILALAAALAAALGGVAVTAGTAHAATATGQQMIVPAYIYPSGTGATQWSSIASGGSAVGMAIANVTNGPGGAADSNWTTALAGAHKAGVKVLGYVDTGYFGTTGRTTRLGETTTAAWLAQAETDVNLWYKFYGSNIDGVFFDDATNVCGPTSGTTTYSDLYAQLSQYVKQFHTGATTVDNPGTDVPQCYENSADVLLTFEGGYTSYQSYTPNSWESGYDPHKFFHVVYSATSSQLSNAVALSKNDNAGYVYITDAGLPNPYSTLPSYWSGELSALPVTSTGTPATPSQPSAISVGGSSVELDWPSASGVVGYDVYQNGVMVDEVTRFTPGDTQFTVRGLTPSTSYTFTVRARDLAGGVSAAGPALTVTTAAANSTAPTAPTGLAASNLLAQSVQLGWTASTDSGGTVTYYDVYANGTLVLRVPATQTSARFDGLTPGQSYTFTVAAVDDSGGLSAASTGVTVTPPVPASDISGAASTLTSSTATYTATYNLEYTDHIVFVDSDNSASTGYQLSIGGTSVGADYMIDNGTLYTYAGGGTDWSWTAQSNAPTESVSGQTYSWQITSSWLGTFATTQKVVFAGSGYSTEAYSSLVTVTEH